LIVSGIGDWCVKLCKGRAASATAILRVVDDAVWLEVCFVLYENKIVVNIYIFQVFYAELRVQWLMQRPLLQFFPPSRGTRMVYPTWNFGGDFEYTKNAISNFLEFFESISYALWFFNHFSSPHNVKKRQEHLFRWFLCESGGNALFKCCVTLKSIFAYLDPSFWRNPHILSTWYLSWPDLTP